MNSYMLPIGTVGHQTGTPAAASTIWSMRNLGTKPLYVTKIYLNATFDGTAAATTARYELLRFRTATPSGGTALTVIKSKTSQPASIVTDAREAVGGLTVTSVTFDTSLSELINQRQVSASACLALEYYPNDINPTQNLAIDPNDGLCIQLGVAAVAGDSLAGFIQWIE